MNERIKSTVLQICALSVLSNIFIVSAADPYNRHPGWQQLPHGNHPPTPATTGRS